MKKGIQFMLLTLGIGALGACSSEKKGEEATVFPPIAVSYPATEKDTAVSDDYHGTLVADPYRWLEFDTAANVEAWVTAQNKVTFGYLEQIPFRSKIKDRLSDIFNYPKYSSPFRVGEYYFFSKNDGLQNQSVIYYQLGLEGEAKVFLDPNKMSEDGTAAVSLLGASKDNKYMAYAINQSGSDWQQINVMEIATLKKLDDVLDWVKFSGAAWKGDGFYYGRYDAPVKGKEFSNKNEFHKIYFHKIGTPQSQDQLIYDDKKFPLRYYGAQTTEDERFLIINVSEGTDGTELYCKDLAAGQKDYTMIFKGFEDNANVIDNIGDMLILQTDAGAPNQKVVLLDPKNPAKENWKEIISEKPELLQSVNTGGGKIFTTYLKDVTTRLYQHDMTGKVEHEIDLPTLGTSGGLGGKKDDKVLFYTFTSFTYPATIYK